MRNIKKLVIAVFMSIVVFMSVIPVTNIKAVENTSLYVDPNIYITYTELYDKKSGNYQNQRGLKSR
ncbi:MAG: hypothetical protein KAW45_01460 [Thermoplasmatales archaeon]|nr:hypothetical protein [Thermoplasmatales archaeon]